MTILNLTKVITLKGAKWGKESIRVTDPETWKKGFLIIVGSVVLHLCFHWYIMMIYMWCVQRLMFLFVNSPCT